ncbi:hypothetical protein Rs2_16925 [Raphanus sativus]|nr:hypothetical protein Rs2_16925 [Raphanus sativus]
MGEQGAEQDDHDDGGAEQDDDEKLDFSVETWLLSSRPHTPSSSLLLAPASRLVPSPEEPLLLYLVFLLLLFDLSLPFRYDCDSGLAVSPDVFALCARSFYYGEILASIGVSSRRFQVLRCILLRWLVSQSSSVSEKSSSSLSLWLGELCLDVLFLEVSLGPRFAGGDGSRVQVRLVWLCLVEFPAVVYGSWRLPVLLLHLVSPHHGYRSGFSIRKRRLSSGVLSLCVSRYSLFVDTGWRFHSQVNSLWFSKVANVERFSGVIGRLGVLETSGLVVAVKAPVFCVSDFGGGGSVRAFELSTSRSCDMLRLSHFQCHVLRR